VDIEIDCDEMPEGWGRTAGWNSKVYCPKHFAEVAK
jgi:hypothetical protein